MSPGLPYWFGGPAFYSVRDEAAALDGAYLMDVAAEQLEALLGAASGLGGVSRDDVFVGRAVEALRALDDDLDVVDDGMCHVLGPSCYLSRMLAALTLVVVFLDAWLFTVFALSGFIEVTIDGRDHSRLVRALITMYAALHVLPLLHLLSQP